MPLIKPGHPAIRHSTAADLPAVAAIYSHHVLNSVSSFEIVPPDEHEIARRWNTVRQSQLPWLVAELHDGTIAGYAYATLYRPRAAYRFTIEDSIYIHPAHTGQGIGGRLLDALIQACRHSGDFREMIAVIGGSDNLASIKLHERHGFVQIGILRGVGFKFERWVDTVLMQRSF